MKVIPVLVIAAAVGAIRFALHRRAKRADATTATRRPSPAVRYVEATFGDVGLVAARELRERTRGRVYRVGTLLMLVIVAAAVVIPTVVNKAPGRVRVGIVGSVPASYRNAATAAGRELNVGVRYVTEGLHEATDDLRAGRLDAVLEGDRIVLARAITPSDTSGLAQFAWALSAKLSALATIAAARLSPAQAAVIDHPIAIPISGLAPAKQKGVVHGASIIGLILLFALLSQYGAWILMGVAEEKSSRVVEVLLATVRPIHLLSGKVLGIGAAALAQASVIVVFALVLARAVGSDLLNGSAPLGLASTLLWLLLGYAFYRWVYAAAGLLAERQDQLQSLTFPLSIPMLVGYITSITTAASGSASVFFKVLAYLPPTAPFAMPILVELNQASWWGFLLAVAMSIAATVGVARLAAGIYQRAILRTGRRVKLREVLRAT